MGYVLNFRNVKLKKIEKVTSEVTSNIDSKSPGTITGAFVVGSECGLNQIDDLRPRPVPV